MNSSAAFLMILERTSLIHLIFIISSRLTDHTELCWQTTSSLSIDQDDLSDWKSGDFKRLGVFTRNERGKST